jgi:hypothetical protein
MAGPCRTRRWVRETVVCVCPSDDLVVRAVRRLDNCDRQGRSPETRHLQRRRFTWWQSQNERLQERGIQVR